MKRLLLISAFLIVSFSGFSQDYRNAAGIRAGYTGGLEYRFYTNETNSFKFLLGSRERGLVAHVLKEFHRYQLFSFSEQLNVVFGGGLHLGYERWDQRHYRNNTSYYVTRTAFITGLDGLAGLEYMFVEVPVSLGLEVKPYFDILGREMFDFQLFDFAFTVKYHF